jgi:hypothetical protein
VRGVIELLIASSTSKKLEDPMNKENRHMFAMACAIGVVRALSGDNPPPPKVWDIEQVADTVGEVARRMKVDPDWLFKATLMWLQYEPGEPSSEKTKRAVDKAYDVADAFYAREAGAIN